MENKTTHIKSCCICKHSNLFKGIHYLNEGTTYKALCEHPKQHSLIKSFYFFPDMQNECPRFEKSKSIFLKKLKALLRHLFEGNAK